MKTNQTPAPVVTPKHYGLFHADLQIGHCTADNVHDAFRQGRQEFGSYCTGAILLAGDPALTGNRAEPMFL